MKNLIILTIYLFLQICNSKNNAVYAQDSLIIHVISSDDPHEANNVTAVDIRGRDNFPPNFHFHSQNSTDNFDKKMLDINRTFKEIDSIQNVTDGLIKDIDRSFKEIDSINRHSDSVVNDITRIQMRTDSLMARNDSSDSAIDSTYRNGDAVGNDNNFSPTKYILFLGLLALIYAFIPKRSKNV